MGVVMLIIDTKSLLLGYLAGMIPRFGDSSCVNSMFITPFELFFFICLLLSTVILIIGYSVGTIGAKSAATPTPTLT